jgi:peroxiredoxin
MSAKQENLTHEELWDDSALIDSWNEALEEYKVGESEKIGERSLTADRNTTVFTREVAVFEIWSLRASTSSSDSSPSCY